MGNFIYSTLAANQAYTTYVPTDVKQLPKVKKAVLIKGGTGVTEARHIQTPKGVVTEVTDEELQALQENTSFRDHVKNGYITIEAKKVKVAKVAENMNKGDKSRPLTRDDFETGENGQPSKMKRKDVE